MQAQELWSIGRPADICSRLVTPERGAGVCELWLRRGAKRLWTASLVETIAVVLGSYLDSATLAPFIGGLLIPRSERYGDGWLRGPVIRQKWRFG